MENASVALKDKYRLAYLVFLLHGIGILMPWNMFITANDYFTQYKLHPNYTGTDDTTYSSSFLQYLGFASQMPYVVFTYANVFVRIGGSMNPRIVYSISTEVVVFICTVVLAMVDSSGWPGVFFGLTLLSVVVLCMAAAIWQNTIFGMAAKLPPEYIGVIIFGNNVCGTFTSIVSILSIAFASNPQIAAIYYFITALFVLLVCFDSYFVLPLNRFYRHHVLKDESEAELKNATDQNIKKESIPYIEIFKKSWIQLFNVFYIFTVTLSVFPAIHANIKSGNEYFFIPPLYYASILCFLTFNTTATIGSFIPRYFVWPKPKYLWIPVVLRTLYIPFYLLCNYQLPGQKRVLPVLFNNDWIYWFVAITMGLTSGYCSTLAMMFAPGTVEPEHAAVAGMLAGCALITGLFCGILMTFIWPWFIRVMG